MYGGHKCTMLAWWPWRYHGSKEHGGHGYTLMAQHMVAMEASWWWGAWWPCMHHVANMFRDYGHTVVAMEASWWP